MVKLFEEYHWLLILDLQNMDAMPEAGPWKDT